MILCYDVIEGKYATDSDNLKMCGQHVENIWISICCQASTPSSVGSKHLLVSGDGSVLGHCRPRCTT